MATNHLMSTSSAAKPQRKTMVTPRQAAKTSRALTVLMLILACVHPSSQLPSSARAHDSRSPLHERQERQSDGDVQLPQDSVNASKFILTVYNDIVSRPTTGASDLQPNIIRSIDAISGTSCDEFNFNLASINAREVVYRADLRITLRFNRRYNGVWPSVYAVQTLDSTICTWNTIASTTGDSYNLIANVGQVVVNWVFALDSATSRTKGFKVLFFNTLSDYYAKNPINTCGVSSPIILVPTLTDDRPALVVYSRDPDANRVAAQALLKGIPVLRRDVGRQARALTTPCGVNQLIFQASTLNAIALLPNQTILHPPQIDGGICGGLCYNAYPDSSAPNTALIAHFVTRSMSSNYRQCCIPIEFGSQTFLSTSLGGVTMLRTVENMRVTKCSCLDIMN